MLNIGRSKWRFITLFTICMCLLFSLQAYASQPVEQSASSTVEAFFNAMLEKDFNVYASNSVDTLPLSVRRQLFENGDVLGYQIESVQKVDNEHATAIVKVSEKDIIFTMKYPVIFVEKKWVVDLDNSENIAQHSSDGKEIPRYSVDSQNIPPSGQTATPTSILTLLTQYGGTLGNGFSTFVYSGQFSPSSNYITVKGYQEPVYSGYDIVLAYGLDLRYEWGWRSMNNFQYVYGTYYESGSWFERQFGVTSGYIYRLVATIPVSDMDKQAYAAGNVYN